MKRMIMAMVLIASVFTAKAQSSFEIKADAFIDEVEMLSNHQSESAFDYSSLLSLADILIRDPAFTTSWASYIENEAEQRQASGLPFQCLQTNLNSYYSCVYSYNGDPIPPAVPPYGSVMNSCQFSFINGTNYCLGLPGLPYIAYKPAANPNK